MPAAKPNARTKAKKKGAAIRAPEQARSRETMANILDAMESLLTEKPFDRITIQEVAQRSGAGVSSIYARFRDKQSLVMGLHAQVREEVLECVEQLSDPERWQDTPTEEIVAGVVPPCVKWYRKHGALVRAAVSINEPELRERQAGVLRFAGSRFTDLLASRYPKHIEALEAAIDGSVRMLVSVMYVSLIFEGVEMSRKPLTDRALIQTLVQSITALLKAAQHGE